MCLQLGLMSIHNLLPIVNFHWQTAQRGSLSHQTQHGCRDLVVWKRGRIAICAWGLLTGHLQQALRSHKGLKQGRKTSQSLLEYWVICGWGLFILFYVNGLQPYSLIPLCSSQGTGRWRVSIRVKVWPHELIPGSCLPPVHWAGTSSCSTASLLGCDSWQLMDLLFISSKQQENNSEFISPEEIVHQVLNPWQRTLAVIMAGWGEIRALLRVQ